MSRILTTEARRALVRRASAISAGFGARDEVQRSEPGSDDDRQYKLPGVADQQGHVESGPRLGGHVLNGDLKRSPAGSNGSA